MNDLQKAILMKIAHGGGLQVYADIFGARGGRIKRYHLRLYCSPHLAHKNGSNCVYCEDVNTEDLPQAVGDILCSHIPRECSNNNGHCYIDDLMIHAIGGSVARFILTADILQIIRAGNPVDVVSA